MSRLETEAKSELKVRVLIGEALKLACEPGNIPWPEDSLGVGAFDQEGKCVGRMVMINLPHLEGAWVADDRKGTTLAFRLLNGLEDVLRTLGRTHLFTFIPSADMNLKQMAERIGFKRLPWDIYLKEI